MISRGGIKPDVVVYNHVLSSLASTKLKSGERYEMAKNIWGEMEMEQGGICTDATYKTLISIFSKENQWGDVAVVRDKINASGRVSGSGVSASASVSAVGGVGGGNISDGDKSTNSAKSSSSEGVEKNPLTPDYIMDLEKLEKVDNVKKPWYKLGKVVRAGHGLGLGLGGGESKSSESDTNMDVVFGIQTHRNPVLNGLSLVFYTGSGEKLGYMLIRNHLDYLQHSYVGPDQDTDVPVGRQSKQKKQKLVQPVQEQLLYSSIMGMYIDENHRGKGLANIFMGIWLQICLNSNALPRSENINKPLLSLVLANFGLVPVSDSAIEVEISPIANVQDSNTQRSWKPLFALYSLRPLNFGERELRIQRMVVTRFPPSPRGKVTAVKTIFEHPMTQNARNGEDYAKEKSELSRLIRNVWRGARKDKTRDGDSYVDMLMKVTFISALTIMCCAESSLAIYGNE